jgi:hypothetical protein
LPPRAVKARSNGEIRGTPTVDLIGPSGERLGIVPLAEALRAALAQGCDLVEVGPNRTPPVCKLVDRAKLSYEAKARAAKERLESRDSGLTIIATPPTSFSLVSSDLVLFAAAFEAHGHSGNGYSWQAVAQHLVATGLPELAERIEFDAEADMFCARSEDRAALELLRDRLDRALCSRVELARLIESVPDSLWDD